MKASYDVLVGMFVGIARSVERVKFSTKIEKTRATPAMTEVVVKVTNIMVELVSVLAVANKRISQKWLSQSFLTKKHS